MADSPTKAGKKASHSPKAKLHQTPEEVIAKRRKGISQRRYITAFLIKLTSTALAFWLIFALVFGVAMMDGESMFPKIVDGDILLFFRLEGNYQTGNVVIFKADDGKRYVGRIVAGEGDTVDISDAGELIVNGNVQYEEIFYPTYKADTDVGIPCTLTRSQVFLLSDFRTEGTDSRTYGAVWTGKLDGKVISVLRRRGI